MHFIFNHFRMRRLVAVVGLTTVLFFLYLGSSCWPAMLNLFGHRRNVLDELRHRGKNCFFSSTCESSSNDELYRQRASLLARPLRQILDSVSVRQLTVERIKFLLTNASEHRSNGFNSSQRCAEQTTYQQQHSKESYQTRFERLKHFCESYKFNNKIFTYRSSTSNRRYGSSERNLLPRYCSTKTCPLLVDVHHHVLACFVQKVASTSVKRLFMRLLQNVTTYNTGFNSSRGVEMAELMNNLTIFHQTANENLYRISPLYIRALLNSQFFKVLFVRHPFVRLVSAFKDKGERGPESEPYFYAQYWNPLMDQIYGKGNWNQSSRVTFNQFVNDLLLQTDPYEYDEHWAPIWTRCEPCFVHYDFIGKLESSVADFKAFKARLDKSLLNVTIWENSNKHFGNTVIANSDEKTEKQCLDVLYKYAETQRYLAQLEPQSIIELYKRYYLDFELFGYTLEEIFA